MITEDKRKKIAETLAQRKSQMLCPMCGSTSFSLLDGFIIEIIQEDLTKIQLDGRTLPSATIVCGRCGFISHHAIGALGLMKIMKDQDEEK